MKTFPLAAYCSVAVAFLLLHVFPRTLDFDLTRHSDSLSGEVSPYYVDRATSPSRSSGAGNEDGPAEDNLEEENPGDKDAGTNVDSAGLGVEFETSDITIERVGSCPRPIYYAAKGKQLGRRGDMDSDWVLTADTTLDMDKLLTAEYWINGKTVKIGKNQAVPAAEAIVHDLASWNPRAPQRITVRDCPCTWRVRTPKRNQHSRTDIMEFQPQVTGPMPLEGIQQLIWKYKRGQSSPLINTRRRLDLILVTKDFFQARPGGINPDTVTADVLGFFSLLISCAKFAKRAERGMSLKNMLAIMPRSDFITLYQQVKQKINSDDLLDIVKVLVCYKNGKDDTSTVLDTEWCRQRRSGPELILSKGRSKLDKAEFVEINRDGLGKAVLVKDWISDIAARSNEYDENRKLDKLSKLDEVIDGSIGHWRGRLEPMYDSARKVPLFEFRLIPRKKAGDFVETVREVEDVFMSYHKRYADPPSTGQQPGIGQPPDTGGPADTGHPPDTGPSA